MSDHNKERLIGAIEAILFAKGAPVTIEDLSKALKISKDEVSEALFTLKDQYLKIDRGICLARIDDGYELATKKEYYPELASIVSLDNKYIFTDAMLETLSIVAYKQPCTRAQVEEVRGVSSSNQISKLVEYGLIYESDRLDAPGRPFLFSTTDDFLRFFDLEKLEDLPEVPEALEVKLQMEAEAEVPDDIPSKEEMEAAAKKDEQRLEALEAASANADKLLEDLKKK